MTIQFDQIPSNYRIPIVAMEFDATLAGTGELQEKKILAIGTMLSGGTASANTPVIVSSRSQAKNLFGDGSELDYLIAKILKNSRFVPITVLPVGEDGAGVQAEGTITVSGSCTNSGSVYIYVAGRRIVTSILEGDTASEIATKIVAAITEYDAEETLPATFVVNGVTPEQIDMTARGKGESGNDIDIRENFTNGDLAAEGVTLAIVAMNAGANNPSLTTPLTHVEPIKYEVLVSTLYDTTSMSGIEDFCHSRWDAMSAEEGVCIFSATDTKDNLATKGNARNSQYNILVGQENYVDMPLEIAGAVAGQVAKSVQNDPALPFQHLKLEGITGGKPADVLTEDEKNYLLKNAISTLYEGTSGVYIQRLITTYKTDSMGNPDNSMYDANVMFILSHIREDTVTTFSRKFPRFKLADAGTRIAQGQRIVTVETFEVEMRALYSSWIDIGLVEQQSEFNDSIIVERDTVDLGRVNMGISPNLINQFRILAIRTSFLN